MPLIHRISQYFTVLIVITADVKLSIFHFYHQATERPACIRPEHECFREDEILTLSRSGDTREVREAFSHVQVNSVLMRS
jgi:hypothetical protein